MKEISVISKKIMKSFLGFLKNCGMFACKMTAYVLAFVLCVISRVLLTVGLLIKALGHVAFFEYKEFHGCVSDLMWYWRGRSI